MYTILVLFIYLLRDSEEKKTAFVIGRYVRACALVCVVYGCMYIYTQFSQQSQNGYEDFIHYNSCSPEKILI